MKQKKNGVFVPFRVGRNRLRMVYDKNSDRMNSPFLIIALTRRAPSSYDFPSVVCEFEISAPPKSSDEIKRERRVIVQSINCYPSVSC